MKNKKNSCSWSTDSDRILFVEWMPVKGYGFRPQTHLPLNGDREVVGRGVKFVTYPNGSSQQTNLPELQ